MSVASNIPRLQRHKLMEASLERISAFSTRQNNKPGCRITTRELFGFETALLLTVRETIAATI
jgi:hypothetical protein